MKKSLSLYFLLFSVIGTMSSQETWKKIQKEEVFLNKKLIVRQKMPKAYKLFMVDLNVLSGHLSKTRNKQLKSSNPTIVKLPTPKGIQRFSVTEASVFSDELAAKYPEIKSYVGIGLDDPTARARFSKSKDGFHAMISSGNYPLYLIDPYTKDKKISIAYSKSTQSKANFECLVDENRNTFQQQSSKKSSNANDGKLRTYRLALIGTAEYSQFHLTNQNVPASATNAVKKAAVLSAMNTSITRVNGVFERDLSVTMKIVSNNENLIFLMNGGDDELTDDDANTLLSESQTKCDALIGNANYDIGHALGTGGASGSNGVALGGGTVCVTGQKAQGVTMSPNPISDTFDIDFIIHEMGHQFGANHTQNNDCNRNNGTAVEPGSASTIMGYAGICSPNVQNNSDAYFHAVNIAEMWNIVTTSATCGVETLTNNTAPIANAGADFTIPKSTPFILKGIGSDVDASNSLTFNWEQIDNEIATMSPVSTNTDGPMFRSLISSASPNRFMPALNTVLAGSTSTTWEVLPEVARVLNFSLTVRDNVSSGAATARDDMTVTVNGDSGPFVITSQTINTTLNGNSTQTVTWDVANTNIAPVNCILVNILLSTDGGQTYPNILKSNTTNDGSEKVTLTNITTNTARIKIEPVNNIFYAVNTVNFSIDKVAGVEDEQFANFNLFPNPSKGKITVKFDVKSSDEIHIQLFDIRGRRIYVKEFPNVIGQFSKELDYSSIVKGLYILKVSNGLKRISKKIFIE
jgi:hypothetical protein